MHPRFAEVANSLHPAFERLMAMPPVQGGIPSIGMPERGVYLFSEGDQHLYIGRSNTLRKRYSGHCRPASPHGAAAFAFKLARIKTGNSKPQYKQGAGTRAELRKDPIFEAAFTAAKTRIGGMDYRFVEETDQVRQAVLEIYCAVVLGTPYNDFKTS